MQEKSITQEMTVSALFVEDSIKGMLESKSIVWKAPEEDITIDEQERSIGESLIDLANTEKQYFGFYNFYFDYFYFY